MKPKGKKIKLSRYVNRNKVYMKKNWEDYYIRSQFQDFENFMLSRINHIKIYIARGYLEADISIDRAEQIIKGYIK